MSSLFTHAIYGFTIGVIFEQSPHLKPVKKIGGVALCALTAAISPDFDAIPTFLGVPYGSFFGHRGFFHSPFFYLLFAPALAWLTILWVGFDKEQKPKAWFLLSCCYFLSMNSHSVLDALTDGGKGVMLNFPFDSERHFFSWQPIPVSPMNLQAFLSKRGLEVLLGESAFFVPALALSGSLRLVAGKSKADRGKR
jgi:inner membrane protein